MPDAQELVLRIDDSIAHGWDTCAVTHCSCKLGSVDPVLACLTLYKGVRDFAASMRLSYHYCHCLMASNVHNCLLMSSYVIELNFQCGTIVDEMHIYAKK